MYMMHYRGILLSYNLSYVFYFQCFICCTDLYIYIFIKYASTLSALKYNTYTFKNTN